MVNDAEAMRQAMEADRRAEKQRLANTYAKVAHQARNVQTKEGKR